MEHNILRVAVMQSASVLFNKQGTIEKLLTQVAEAKEAGAQLVVFPEAFIPAYPRGLHFSFYVGGRKPEGRLDWQRYYDNAILVPGPETDVIAGAAIEHGVYVTVGVIEKAPVGGTVFCTYLFFGPQGYLGKHRKLKPTAAERFLWGEGDGSTISVFDTPFGRMGSVICWENYMPLLRYRMYEKGVDIYLAPTADDREPWVSSMVHIAREGRCFVIGCNQFVTKDMYPKDLHCLDELDAIDGDIVCHGGSCVVTPFGHVIAGPVWDKEEMLVADLELAQITQSKVEFDAVGHYARPDVFELKVHE